MITILSNEELVRAMYQKLPEEHTPLELELPKRLDAIVSVESAEEIERRLDKEYESIVEQSYFRAELIAQIRDSAPPRYKKQIERMIEGSYVEL